MLKLPIKKRKCGNRKEYLFHNKFDQGQKETLFISALEFTNKIFPDKSRGEIFKKNERQDIDN